MKRSLLVLVSILMFSVLILSACGGNAGGNGNTADVEVPAPYAGQTNPFAGDAEAATAGQQTYQTYCASCHGPDGAGDGPAAASLDPKPADLHEVGANDPEDLIHWVIAEGGSAAGLSSSMPPFKGTLSEDQIWQLVTYIKTLN